MHTNTQRNTEFTVQIPWAGSGLDPVAGNSALVSPMGDRDPSTWDIACCFLRSTLGDLNPGR